MSQRRSGSRYSRAISWNAGRMYTVDTREVKSSMGPSAMRRPCSAISTKRGVAVENTVMPASRWRMALV